MGKTIKIPSTEVMENINNLPMVTDCIKEGLIELYKVDSNLLDVVEVCIADFIDRYIDTDINISGYTVTNIDTFTPHTTCSSQNEVKEYIKNTIGPDTCEYCEINLEGEIKRVFVASLHMTNDSGHRITATCLNIVELTKNNYYLVDSLSSEGGKQE